MLRDPTPAMLQATSRVTNVRAAARGSLPASWRRETKGPPPAGRERRLALMLPPLPRPRVGRLVSRNGSRAGGGVLWGPALRRRQNAVTRTRHPWERTSRQRRQRKHCRYTRSTRRRCFFRAAATKRRKGATKVADSLGGEVASKRSPMCDWYARTRRLADNWTPGWRCVG